LSDYELQVLLLELIFRASPKKPEMRANFARIVFSKCDIEKIAELFMTVKASTFPEVVCLSKSWVEVRLGFKSRARMLEHF
jgi:hypothetical protein